MTENINMLHYVENWEPLEHILLQFELVGTIWTRLYDLSSYA
mgnify:CR=1 FL=1